MDGEELAYSLTVQAHSEGKFRKKDPLYAQALIPRKAEKEKEMVAQREEEEMDWCRDRVKRRLRKSKITNVTITGRTRIGGLMITMTIFGDDQSVLTDTPSFLKLYGYSEWLEIREAIQKSKSKYKKVVEHVLN